jgi:hypothetical protein
MQKIVNWGVLSLLLLLTACTTTSNPIDISISETNMEKTGLAANIITMNFSVTNRNSQAATIHWDRVEHLSVSGWAYELNGNTSNSGVLNIPANSSVNIIVSMIANGNIGVGSGTIEFYDPAHQQVSSQTLNYKLTALNEYFRLNLAIPAHKTSYISSSTPTDSHTHHVWLINDNTIPMVVQWARTNEQTIPTTWFIWPKTHDTCYPPSAMISRTIIPPMDSIPFKLAFHHHSTSGYGRTTPVFWVDTDSMNSVKIQPFTYEVLP